MPSHCGLIHNERADAITKEASHMDQSQTLIDVSSATRAVARAARKSWQSFWPDGWYREIFRDRLPSRVRGDDRHVAVDVHQLRAGHWSESEQYLHRIGRRPTTNYQGCNDRECLAALRRVCKEEADTSRQIPTAAVSSMPVRPTPPIAGKHLRAAKTLTARRRGDQPGCRLPLLPKPDG